jgi:hypothetical protein
MTALWTVTILLAALAVADSVAVIALTRQVGLLHLRIRPEHQQPPAAPVPGSRLPLDPTRGFPAGDPAPDLVLLGFLRPACGSCTAALPAFASVASGLPRNEQAMLVSDADETATRAYLAMHNVSLPLAAGPHLLSANGIPTVPYAVIADATGKVLAAAAATTEEQLDAILRHARGSRQAVR